MICIRDNNCGICNAGKSKAKTFGIAAMQERPHAFGGTVNLNVRPGGSATLTIELPLSEKKC